MATAADIINAMFRKLRIVDSDATADTTQLANGLLALNTMVDAWNAEKLTLYQEVESSHTLTGAASYTIGPSGVFNVGRPQRILSAYYTDTNSNDYKPMRLADKEDFDNIVAKTSIGYPEVLYYDRAFPQGILHLWPNPSNGTLKLTQTLLLTEFAATSTTFSLPPGYRAAMIYNLCIDYAPEGGILTQEIIDGASRYLGIIKRANNQQTPEMRSEIQRLVHGGRSNILTDE